MQQAIRDWRAAYADERSVVGFAVEDGEGAGRQRRRTPARPGRGRAVLGAVPRAAAARGLATRAVRLLADYALTETGQGGLGYSRVEAKVEPGNEASLRVATRPGLRREGVRRVEPGTGDRRRDHVVRRPTPGSPSDPPLTEPEAFRALLNSFLPRKRAISQLLVRDRDGRVLICQLTYKRDWDLPGGVVEVGESPQLRGRPRDRGGARPRRSRPATCCSPTGCRRGAAGTTRSAWSSTAACTTRRSSHGIVLQAREIRRRRVRHRWSRCASGAPTSPPAGSSRRWPASTAAPDRRTSRAAATCPRTSARPSDPRQRADRSSPTVDDAQGSGP